MIKLILTLVVAAGGVVLADGPTIVTTGGIQGTWTRAGNPYLIIGNVEVPPGSSLKIESEVRVEFQGPYSLTVFGRLNVEGKGDRGIIFRSSDDNEEGWAGLRFIKTEEPCDLHDFVLTDVVNNGQGAAIYAEESELTLTNFAISDNRATGKASIVSLMGGRAVLTNGAVGDNSTENETGVVSCKACELVMTNMAIGDNYGVGLLLLNEANAVLTNIAVADQSGEFGWGIICRGSELRVTNGAVADNSEGGIMIKGGSKANFTTCAISGVNAFKQDDGSDVSMVLTAVSEE